MVITNKTAGKIIECITLGLVLELSTSPIKNFGVNYLEVISR